MQYLIEDQFSFNELIKEMVNDNEQRMIHKKLGDGFIKSYQIQEGAATFYTFKVNFREPILVNWECTSASEKQYFLFLNQYEDKKENSVRNREKSVESGMSLFNNYNKRRRIWLPNKVYEMYLLQFSQQWLDDFGKLFSSSYDVFHRIVDSDQIDINMSPNRQFFDAFQSLAYNASLMASTLSKEYRLLKFKEIILLYINELNKRISPKKDNKSVHPDDLEKLNFFMTTLRNRMDHLPTIAQAALELGMSESKFQRLFKKVEQTTYYSFVLSLRMNYAMDLLMSSTSVTETAFRTGYTNIANFSYTFKKHFDMLPSDVPVILGS